MAFYPDVNPGESFKPIATLENELRHIVNAQNGFLGTVHTGSLLQNLVVPVYNCGDDDLEANSAVSFATEQQQYSLEDVAAAPVQKYTSGTRWGVLTSALAPQEFGSCVISGVAVVEFSGSGSPDALSPSADGKTFSAGSEVQCIYADKKNALIVLTVNNSYAGYLKAIYYPKEKQYGLICGFDPENEIAGFCWVNGQRRNVFKSTRAKPKEGFLCISGKIDSDQIGLEIKDQIPGKATGGSDTDYHPIALIKKTGENEHETFSCFQLSRYEFPQLWIMGECEEDSEGD